MGRTPFLSTALRLLFDRHHCTSGKILRLCFLPHWDHNHKPNTSASTVDQQAALLPRASDNPSLTMRSSGATPTQRLFSSSRRVRKALAISSINSLDTIGMHHLMIYVQREPVMRESASHAFCLV